MFRTAYVITEQWRWEHAASWGKWSSEIPVDKHPTKPRYAVKRDAITEKNRLMRSNYPWRRYRVRELLVGGIVE